MAGEMAEELSRKMYKYVLEVWVGLFLRERERERESLEVGWFGVVVVRVAWVVWGCIGGRLLLVRKREERSGMDRLAWGGADGGLFCFLFF
ncbi:hypothetical protein PRUPE_1G215700 [Prunus persica]|uniref:Uncharacterized protein n=1 Tax=Prunus persica TaxID=3760 RepID=M5XHR0_PRUPE|nr:hypothetical protein PRUPE_1G215700 [Prunus persica]